MAMASLTRSRPKRKSKLGFWRWLEYRYARPEFSGSLLLSLAIFFFIAATNTLAGWLYVISGISMALVLINLILPGRLLAQLQLQRSPLKPVSAGDQFWQELQITNTSHSPLELIGIQDHIPFGLQLLNHPTQTPADKVIESILPQQSYRWCYSLQALKRGLYRFDSISLFTSSPLGLCRSSRTRSAPQTLTVYPQVLALSNCPIIDQLGLGELRQFQTWSRKPQTASQGMTKALRPYRWGDPIRLVHWRSSAKFGELRVRELEVNPGGAELVIGIDLDQGWRSLDFEQAVVTAASLYFYAKARNLEVKIWTGTEPDCTEQSAVLHLLAKIQPRTQSASQPVSPDFPTQPIIWLTAKTDQLSLLPAHSRAILWQTHSTTDSSDDHSGSKLNCLTVNSYLKEPLESLEEQSTGILNQDQLTYLQQILETSY